MAQLLSLFWTKVTADKWLNYALNPISALILSGSVVHAELLLKHPMYRPGINYMQSLLEQLQECVELPLHPENNAALVLPALSAEQVSIFLKERLSSWADIIPPDFSPISPIDPNQQQAVMASVNYLNWIHGEVKPRTNGLVRPLIIPLCLPPQATGLPPSSWRLVVILPQPTAAAPLFLYWNPQGHADRKEALETVAVFLKVLTEGIRIQAPPAPGSTQAKILTFPIAFPTLNFRNISPQQALQGAASPFLLIYQVMHVVCAGQGARFEEHNVQQLIHQFHQRFFVTPSPKNIQQEKKEERAEQYVAQAEEQKIEPQSAPRKKEQQPTEQTVEAQAVSRTSKVMDSTDLPEAASEEEKIPDSAERRASEQELAYEEKCEPYKGPDYRAIDLPILLSQAGAVIFSEKMSLPSKQEFISYFHLLQPLTPDLLLQDLIAYIQQAAHVNDIKNRRVCFLLQTSDGRAIALLMQTQQVNLEVAQQLIAAKSAQQPVNVPIALIKQLYASVSFQVLGAPPSQALLQPITQAIGQAYVGSGKIAIACKPITPQQAHHIVLLEDVVNMLESGKTKPVDLKDAYEQRTSACKEACIEYFDRLNLDDKTDRDIATTFLGIMKLSLLQAYRHQMEASLKGHREPEKLEQLIEANERLKIFFYNQETLDVAQFLQQQTIETIAQLLKLQTNKSALLNGLEQQFQKLNRDAVSWEENIQEEITQKFRCTPGYALARLKRAAMFAYQGSIIPLTTIVTQFLGNIVITPLAKYAGETFAARFPRFTQYARAIDPFTQIPIYMPQTAQLAQWVKPKIYPAIGASLGVAWIYYNGIYSHLGHGLLVVFSADHLRRFVIVNRLDERQARLRTNLPDDSIFIGVSSLSLSAVEALITGDKRNMALTLGGILGSMSTRYVHKISPKFEEQKKRFAGGEIQDESEMHGIVLSLFLLSMGGYLCGRTFAAVGYDQVTHVLNKMQDQTAVLQALTDATKQGKLPTLTVEKPDIAWSPRLWFNSRNSLRLSQQNAEGMQDANCQIIPGAATLPSSEILKALVCEVGESGFRLGNI